MLSRALVLIFLACWGHARRLLISSDESLISPTPENNKLLNEGKTESKQSNLRMRENSIRDPLSALSVLFLGFHTSAAFHPAANGLPGVHPVVFNRQLSSGRHVSRMTSSANVPKVDVLQQDMLLLGDTVREMLRVENSFNQERLNFRHLRPFEAWSDLAVQHRNLGRRMLEIARRVNHMPKYRLANRVGPDLVALAEAVQSAWVRLDGWTPKEAGQLGYVAEEGALGVFGNDEGKLVLENVLGQSRVFRHLHLELAAGANGLRVVHCVMYPWPEYNLPIFSMDVVGFGSRTTLCIADVCPVEDALCLPKVYTQSVPAMQVELGGAKARLVPEWGGRIFSKLCVCVRPGETGEEVPAFVRYVKRLLTMHVAIAELTGPVGDKEAEKVRAAQVRYCEEQLRNDKTRRVLAAALGEDFATSYMTELMFDVTPVTPLRAHE